MTTTIESKKTSAEVPEARFCSGKRPGVWRVRVTPGDQDLTGECVEVFRRDGARVPVVLTRLLSAGDAERAALYAFVYGHSEKR
jgi:hypothetical protein